LGIYGEVQPLEGEKKLSTAQGGKENRNTLTQPNRVKSDLK
jgi:hypothetical protein